MKWTPEEDAAIREHYPTKAAHELSATVLPGRSVASIHTRAYTLHVKKAAGMAAVFTRRKTDVHHWTDDEVAVLVERFPNDHTKEIARDMGLSYGQVSQKAHSLRLAKSEAFHARQRRINSDLSKTNPTIKASQFQRGQVAWNKGKHYAAGGRSAVTRFKKGNIPHTHLPVGSERNRDGVLWRKVADTGIKSQDWLPVHHIIWFESGGEIPSGHMVCFKDGNRRNFSLSNLELVTRAENMRRNTIHNYGPEVAAIIRLNVSLKRAIANRGD
jgi:hypothetical protein